MDGNRQRRVVRNLTISAAILIAGTQQSFAGGGAVLTYDTSDWKNTVRSTVALQGAGAPSGMFIQTNGSGNWAYYYAPLTYYANTAMPIAQREYGTRNAVKTYHIENLIQWKIFRASWNNPYYVEFQVQPETFFVAYEPSPGSGTFGVVDRTGYGPDSQSASVSINNGSFVTIDHSETFYCDNIVNAVDFHPGPPGPPKTCYVGWQNWKTFIATGMYAGIDEQSSTHAKTVLNYKTGVGTSCSLVQTPMVSLIYAGPSATPYSVSDPVYMGNSYLERVGNKTVPTDTAYQNLNKTITYDVYSETDFPSENPSQGSGLTELVHTQGSAISSGDSREKKCSGMFSALNWFSTSPGGIANYLAGKGWTFTQTPYPVGKLVVCPINEAHPMLDSANLSADAFKLYCELGAPDSAKTKTIYATSNPNNRPTITASQNVTLSVTHQQTIGSFSVTGGTSTLGLTVSCQNGLLTLNGKTGASVTMTGTVSQINQQLAVMTYAGTTQGFQGSDMIGASVCLASDSTVGTATAISVTDPVPTTPTQFSGTVSPRGLITLQWVQPSVPYKGIAIQRKVTASGSYSDIDQVWNGNNTFVDVDVQPATQYYYRIRAIGTAGDSAYSPELALVTSAFPGPTRLLVTQLPLPTTGFRTIRLDWEGNAPNADGYKIERKGGSGVYEVIGTTMGWRTTFDDVDVDNGVYTYRVTAFTGIWDSLPSNDACAQMIHAAGDFINGKDFVFLIQTQPGATYQVFSSPDLITWTGGFDSVSTSRQYFLWFHQNIMSLDHRFYKVKVTPPNQAPEYWLPIVGFVQKPINANQLYIVADQFDRIPNLNVISDVLKDLPDGSQYYQWNGGAYNTATKSNGVWDQPNMQLNPGDAGWILTPSAFTLRFSGYVRTGTLINQMPANQTLMRSSILPIAGTPQQIGMTGSGEGDDLYLYHIDNLNDGWVIYTFLDGGWLPTPPDPVIGIGEGFIYTTGPQSFQWTQIFNPPARP